MQIATATSPTTTPAPIAAARPNFDNVDIARAARPGHNLEIVTHARTTRGETSAIGNQRGYASIEDALSAATRLTTGKAAGAAVFSANNRFYLNRVSLLNFEHSWYVNWTPYDAIGSFGERSFTFARPDVAALVDGDVVVRAGKLGDKVTFPAAH